MECEGIHDSSIIKSESRAGIGHAGVGGLGGNFKHEEEQA